MIKRKLCLVILSLFLLNSISLGAITFNSTSSGNDAGQTNTFAHTVNAGSNKILTVGVAVEDATTVQTVTGITWNAVENLIQIDTQVYNGTKNRVDLWYLLNPTVATANIVVTLSGDPSASQTAGAITINGAKQQGPEISAKATGSSVTISVNITTQTNDAWIIDSAANDSSSNDMTAGGGQTERYEEATNQRHNGSTKPFAVAGATSMSWSILTRPWGIVAASFEEFNGNGEPPYVPKVIIIRDE